MRLALTYPEDLGILGLEEVLLQLDGFLQADQELSLEGDDLLDVTKQLLDFARGQKGRRLERDQVLLRQTVQVL